MHNLLLVRFLLIAQSAFCILETHIENISLYNLLIGVS